MAWFSEKPDLPYWVNELFSHEEAHLFIQRCVGLLWEKGYRPRRFRGSSFSLQGMQAKHPDWPRILSIMPRETPVLSARRYEIEVVIIGVDNLEGARFVLMATDGPDIRVTPERLMGQLEALFFLPSLSR